MFSNLAKVKMAPKRYWCFSETLLYRGIRGLNILKCFEKSQSIRKK